MKSLTLVQLLGPMLLTSALAQDPLLGHQWGLYYQDDAMGTGVVDVWDDFDQRHKVTIAIVDNGFDLNHPDLKENLAINSKEIPGNRIDDDQNGYVDDVYGINTGTVSGAITTEDHGTHVAGIIGAVHNNQGVAGVVSNVALIPVQVELGYDADQHIAAGIYYAIDRGAQVINLSLGGANPHMPHTEAAIAEAKKYNVILVIAAGNNGEMDGTEPNFPASFSEKYSNVISVASSTKEAIRSSFSSYGLNNVSIMAPGSDIASTLPGGEYGYMSGTSMASPMVAGIVGLVLSVHGPRAAVNMRDRLINTARRIQSASGLVAAHGLIDAYTAVSGQLSIPYIWTD